MKKELETAVSESGFGRRVLAVVAAAVLLPLLLSLIVGTDRLLEQRAELARAQLASLAHSQAVVLAESSDGIPRDFATRLNGRYAAVVDQAGRTHYSSADLPVDLAELVARDSLDLQQSASTVHRLSWYADSTEWSGAVRMVPRAAKRGEGPTFLVVFEPVADWRDLAMDAAPFMAWLIVFGILSALAAALYLMRCYVPALRALQAALRSLAEGRQVAVSSHGVDEVANIATQLRVTADATSRRLAAHAAQSEVDCALLGNLEVDQGIETALPKLLGMTVSRAVGVILIDEVTSTHGRLLRAADKEEPLPIERVMLDTDMLLAVQAAPEGMTVARVEKDRHAFLTPFTQLGAGFFWLWPILRNDKLVSLVDRWLRA